jgi:hypothetical protein
MMTKLQLAKLRQKTRALKNHRNVLEHLAQDFRPMVQASLVERHFHPGHAPRYYLSIPAKPYSWHMYVRKSQLDHYRRRTLAWREFSNAMADWVKTNKEIEQLLRRLGKGRCEKLEIRRGKKRRKPGA